MIAEDLHARFGVGIIRWFESEPIYAHFGEEDFHEADQTTERQTVISYYTLDLVEFSEMRSVDSFVSENSVDREITCRARDGREFIQHRGRDRSGMGT